MCSRLMYNDLNVSLTSFILQLTLNTAENFLSDKLHLYMTAVTLHNTLGGHHPLLQVFLVFTGMSTIDSKQLQFRQNILQIYAISVYISMEINFRSPFNKFYCFFFLLCNFIPCVYVLQCQWNVNFPKNFNSWLLSYLIPIVCCSFQHHQKKSRIQYYLIVCNTEFNNFTVLRQQKI